MKVLNGEDGEAAISRIDLDEEEKAIAQEGLSDRKILRDFRIKRKLRKELNNYRATVELIKSETKGNRRFLEVLVVEKADFVAEDLRAEGAQSVSSRRLEFIFNNRKQKLRISNKREIGSQEEISKLQASPDFKLPDNAVELDKEEYLRNLTDDGLQAKENEKISLVMRNLKSSLSNTALDTLPANITAQTRTLNRSIMRQYIAAWVVPNSNPPVRNPGYRVYDNDCTNFASQVLEAGGWPRVGNDSSSTTNLNLWWTTPPSKLLRPYQSNSWTIAPDLYQFINSSGRATPVSSATLLNIGDIIFADWGNLDPATGRPMGISHTMIVSLKSGTSISVSYHSNDKLHVPISTFLSDQKVKLYCWKLKDNY